MPKTGEGNNRNTNRANANGVLGNIGEQIKDILSLQKSINTLGPAAQTVIGALRTLLGLVHHFTQVSNAAADLVKNTGLATRSINDIAVKTVAYNKALELSLKYNISSTEAIQAQSLALQRLGRNVNFLDVGRVNENGDVINPNDNSGYERLMAAAKTMGPERFSELLAGFDEFGISYKTAADYVHKLFTEAGESGLNFQTYSDNFTKNLKMAQNYSFRNGVAGLREMAKRATEIKQDMSQIATFSEKVNTVTGAVETAARLQVLGGQFSQLADPMSLLYGGLADTESLQEKLANMTKGLAKYDPQKKQIDLGPLERMRLREAAQAAGLSSEKLIEQAMAQGRRTEIQNRMGNYGNFSDEVQKLLPNVGYIDENGVAGANINGEFKSLREISSDEDLQKRLVAENTPVEKNVQDIASSLLTLEGHVEAIEKALINQAEYNQIRKGVYRDESLYSNVATTVANVSPDTIGAAGIFDFARTNVIGVGLAKATNLFNELFSSFNADSFEEGMERFKNAMSEITGDEGPLKKLGDDLVESVGGFIKNFYNGVTDYASEYGFTLDNITNNKGQTTEGETVEKAVRATSSTPMSEISKDVGIIRNHIEQAKEEGTGENSNLVSKMNVAGTPPEASATMTFTPEEAKTMYGSTIAGIIDGYIENIWGRPNGAEMKTWEITVDKSSVPATSVSSNAAGTQGQGATTNTNQTENGEYLFKMLGEVKLKVEDTNGKTTNIDIIEQVEKNPILKQQLTSILLKSMSEQDKLGYPNK